MTFRVAQKTLERLEWPRVLAQLRESCRTPQAAGQCEASAGLFAADPAATRALQGETSEARALLDDERAPGLGGVHDHSSLFQRATKGGALAPQELRDLLGSLATLHAAAGSLAANAESAPLLAERALAIEPQRDLERQIERCIDPMGEVRDEASRALRDARAESSRLGAELQRRLERFVRDPNVRECLSDDYYTVRNDRYVLPVRSDSRGRVRGIVHDASNSGTTLFIEPESVVEMNNRLKQAELEAVREVQRVLRELSARVAEAVPALERSFQVLASIDLAFARGRLSQQMRAVEPILDGDGVFELPQLRHPLLAPDEAVPNDLRLGSDFVVLLLSGPNAGGKTVAMKALGLAALMARAGLHVPADPGARVALVDHVLADIGDEQDIRESLSTFSAHMANLAEIVRAAGVDTLVVLDEIGTGTDPSEGASLAQSILEQLAQAGARVVATTHYNLLKEMAEVDPRFCNASVEFDPETLAPTYRVHLGSAGASSATTVAARMGMPGPVLERANALLEREDRQLDRMLSELAASRAALEQEQRAAAALRAESEASRDEYRGKLERLQERRDKLFQSMRGDLDRAFGDAHAQVAAVIRELQRGGRAQDAAKARTRLQRLESRVEEQQAELRAAQGDEAPRTLFDWRHAQPGDRVSVRGGEAVIESLPDRRGRVCVRAGGAKLVLPADQVAPPKNGGKPAARARVRVEGAQPTPLAAGGGTAHCDLRGMRVRDALDQLGAALDRAAAEARDALWVVHGIGTGALRRAVREHLAGSPLVAELRTPEPNQGGEGVTEVLLA